MRRKYYFIYFFVTVILKFCHSCTPFEAKNLGSVNTTLLTSFLGSLDIPVFNASTVPNLESIIEDFSAGSNNEDINLNITQLLTKYGYGAEQHQVQTSDGYLLDIFRIPGNGSVVFLMHGSTCSSDDFVSIGPDQGLPYLLADLGYDVWMGNARGTKHGRKHITLSPDCAEFWDFSWDEIGRFDSPAMIDYVLEETNKQKLAYIGHSQGTTTFYVMTSEFPEYNDKISVMIALSSVAFLGNQNNIFASFFALFYKPIDLVSQAVGLYEVLPDNEAVKFITSTACGTPTTALIFCQNLMFLAFGFDYAQVNATVLPTIYGHYPGGVATKQLVHFGQLVVTGKFNQLDRGVVGNIKKYGTAVPPDYHVEKVTSKVAIIYSDNDYYSTAPDRAKLTSKLPNVIENYRVPFAKFSHIDFLFAKDVRKLVYNKVAEIISDNV